jgi:putative zinc finger/helix-turn-helix YgiT family protein
MNAVCPYCEKTTNIHIKSVREIYEIKGVKIPIKSKHSECGECGRDFATKEQMQEATLSGHAAYRRAADIVSPEEIIRMREKYGASQKAFAKILDLGELTVNSYEQGALVSKSISNLIRFMENTDNFMVLFNKKRPELSAMQIRRIDTALEHQKISTEGNDLFHSRDNFDHIYKVEPRFSGNNHPDLEKLLRLIQLVIFQAGKELYKMAILKILFYIDFTAYKKTTLSITGWPYARLPLGPVPNEYKDVLRAGEDNLFFISRPDETEIGELYGLYDTYNLEDFHNRFDSTYMEIIKTVVDQLKDKTPTELKELTHKEKAWKETAHAALIDYHLANDLLLF